MELTEVKGIGPATAIKLTAAGINTAEDLAKASIEDLVTAGIRKPTATKLVKNAIEVVGTSSEPVKSEEKPKKAPKQTSRQPKAKDESKGEIRAVKIPISYVKGVGPKTKIILESANIISAQDLASKTEDELTELGIGKTTSSKIIANAVDQVGVLPSAEKVSKKPREVKKVSEVKEIKKPSKPKKEKKAPSEPVAEHERSPLPQGIPTKKKRGVQVRKTDLEQEDETISAEKPSGWAVKVKELSQEDIDRRNARQEEIAKSRQITRPIPLKPEPVKAIKTDKDLKGAKPEKVEKKKKKVKLSKKRKKEIVDVYRPSDIQVVNLSSKKRGITGKAGTSKPRITLDRNSYLGKITSHRRSRRVIHDKQMIVKLDNGYKPDQLVGQKVYFTYPDSSIKIPGSVAKRFGKVNSSKILVYFKRGIRREGLNQSIYIK